jgi:Family of unknown function (DUF5681)
VGDEVEVESTQVRNIKTGAGVISRWKPGQSGNPSGRPKGIKGYLLERTHDGKDLADMALRIVAGVEPGFKGPQRLEALKLLLAYTFGQPSTAEGTPEAMNEHLRKVFDQVKERIEPEVYRAAMEVLSDGH